jgi:hypothetical protein
MNGSATQTPLPRLRLNRTTSLPATDDADSTPVAGPSRLHTHLLAVPNGDDDDEESTPKIPPLRDGFPLPAHERSISSQATATTATGENPASRLRALLTRLPNETPLVSQRPPYSRASTAPSEPDSDFDPPDASRVAVHSHPSFAQESLKDLFSHALRESGDTPHKGKGRPRRNSIDLSEVEGTTPERASFKGKAKRKSLSDDELEKLDRRPPLSSIASASELSVSQDPLHLYFQRSPARGLLRYHFFNDHLLPYPPHLKVLPSATFFGECLTYHRIPVSNHDDASNDTGTILKELDDSASFPAATSTPLTLRHQQSVQLPSQILGQSSKRCTLPVIFCPELVNDQFITDLMDQDSEMHNAMNVLDSFDVDSHSRAARATRQFIIHFHWNTLLTRIL